MSKRLMREDFGPTPGVSMSAIQSGYTASQLPRVDPTRITLVISLLTVMAVVAIGVDAWMSYKGFESMPVEWWVSATLTAIVACSQVASGLIQSLGGDPFRGVGGGTTFDKAWSAALKSLYAIDIFSNFQGFGAAQYVNLDLILSSPFSTLGLILWYMTLAVLLAFADELIFRQRDRLMIGKQRNEKLWRLHQQRSKAYDAALAVAEKNAIVQGRQVGESLKVDFDWIEEDEN